jgi:starch synthase (maltosyl-transferring)
VKVLLPVEDRGRLLNDPERPYWGQYLGDEDTRRKPAYHNGTAWSWPFPSYCEALYKFGGEECQSRALAILLSSRELLHNGIPGQIPEVIDGDAPHVQRGCGAQAWGMTELLRVYDLIR